VIVLDNQVDAARESVLPADEDIRMLPGLEDPISGLGPDPQRISENCNFSVQFKRIAQNSRETDAVAVRRPSPAGVKDKSIP
jgi:hypothetical protein